MDNAKIGKAISYLRKRAGYTQKDLAVRIGISDKAVSKWERGISLPDVALLRKLSILLDTDTDSLLAGEIIHHDKRWGGVLRIDENPFGINAGTMIFDKPLVYYLLGPFLLVGIKDIMIECDDSSKSFIKNELGDGQQLGIKLSFDDLDEKYSNYMAVLGRSIIYGVDQTRFFQRAMAHSNRFTILSLPKGMRNIKQGLSFDIDRRIVEDGDEGQIITQYNYYNIPFYFCSSEQLKAISNIECNNSDSFESIDDVYTVVLDRGFVELSINTWDDVNEASSFIKTVQNACGMEVYCLEEIAWRRGFITTEQLFELGEQRKGCPYGKYILSLIN